MLYLLFYINIGALMCQRKQQMHRCSAGSFEPLTGNLVPIVAAGVFIRQWAINRAAIRRCRRRTSCIRAADGWLVASALKVDCRLWLCLLPRLDKIPFGNIMSTNSYIAQSTSFFWTSLHLWVLKTCLQVRGIN